jgi:hypothetical protein
VDGQPTPGSLLEQLGTRFTEQRLRFHQIGTLVRFFLYIIAMVVAVLLSFRLSDQLLLAWAAPSR